MDEDLEGLDELEITITYRASSKVFKRLEERAKKEGRKPGPMARHLLEMALGFRRPDQLTAVQFPHVQPITKKKTANR